MRGYPWRLSTPGRFSPKTAQARLKTEIKAATGDRAKTTQLQAQLTDVTSEWTMQSEAAREALKTAFAPWRDELQGEIDKRAGDNSDYAKAENEVFSKLQEKLIDPDRVFGHGVEKDGKWQTEKQVSSVPVMQFIENGFVRDDAREDAKPANDPSKKKTTNERFDAETVAGMARYGFAPLPGDTMHFDYIEGYNDAVVGGHDSKLEYSVHGRRKRKK